MKDKEQVKAFIERVRLPDEEIDKLYDKYNKEDPLQNKPFDKRLLDAQLQKILKDKQVALVDESRTLLLPSQLVVALEQLNYKPVILLSEEEIE